MARTKGKRRSLIISHSHGHWLEKYIEETNPRALGNFALRESGIAVSFLSKRGGRIPWMGSRKIRSKIHRKGPQIVIMCIGGNDLDSGEERKKPQVVAMDLFTSAKSILQSNHTIKQVGICQIVRRKCWRTFSSLEGDVAVDTVNEFLAAACDGHPSIFFWKHRGLQDPLMEKKDRSFEVASPCWGDRLSRKPVLRHDGVHFNDAGNKLFFRSIRGALLFASKRIHS